MDEASPCDARFQLPSSQDNHADHHPERGDGERHSRQTAAGRRDRARRLAGAACLRRGGVPDSPGSAGPLPAGGWSGSATGALRGLGARCGSPALQADPHLDSPPRGPQGGAAGAAPGGLR